MRFLVDECTGPALGRWLRAQGHDVFSVYESARGLDDPDVLALAVEENRILVTNDKDFGEMIFRGKQPHRGVVFLRLDDERFESKARAMSRLLSSYGDRLANRFTVVSETRIRSSHR